MARANQALFLMKEIKKEIMTRSRLRNKFLRCRSDKNKKAYDEQRNRCVKLVKSAQKAHYSNHSIKDVNDTNKFWKIVKPLFSKKVNTSENITLVKNDNISSEIKIGALLTDLSKAFDCLPHDLIVAKLHAYGFSIESLKLINSYLTERKQRVKMNDQFSSWLDIVVGVPQGSILGPLLFNIFLCDMFLFCNDIDLQAMQTITHHTAWEKLQRK